MVSPFKFIPGFGAHFLSDRIGPLTPCFLYVETALVLVRMVHYSVIFNTKRAGGKSCFYIRRILRHGERGASVHVHHDIHKSRKQFQLTITQDLDSSGRIEAKKFYGPFLEIFVLQGALRDPGQVPTILIQSHESNLMMEKFPI
jgi:hypothetical protein